MSRAPELTPPWLPRQQRRCVDRALRHGYIPVSLFGKAPPAYGKNNQRKGMQNWQLLDNVTRAQLDARQRRHHEKWRTAVTIPTLKGLQAKHRQLDRRRRGAARVIAEMSRGAALHLTSPSMQRLHALQWNARDARDRDDGCQRRTRGQR